MARPTIVAGNWKLNPPRDEGVPLFEAVCRGVAERAGSSGVEVLVFPPHPYLAVLSSNAHVHLGAQDVSTQAWGAFTGEVGASLVREFGATHVLVGHSERRWQLGDDEARVVEKLSRVVDEGLVPVLCVGEKQEERESGETFAVLERQLDAAAAGLARADCFVIAYEPVWAIGTGCTATPRQAAEAHAFLRDRLGKALSAERAEATAVLYGGSVTPDNAPALFAEQEIDGALVGGASLKAEGFLAILDAARSARAPAG